jgi:predicted O-methyltransferase YrrM
VSAAIEGQLNSAERDLLVRSIQGAPRPPEVALEVGTWLGGGSTLHILRALEANGRGHLWGIEADKNIYERMLANIKAAAPQAVHRFTPLFGFSQEVIPQWVSGQPKGLQVDFVFLDGGNNPGEQITEFRLLDPFVPVGGQLMAHDAKLRKGKWLRPYLMHLDNWRTQVHDISDEGLLQATKTALQPSPLQFRQARRALMRARVQPTEIAATLLPSWFCGFALRLLPRRVAVALGEGRESATKMPPR